MVTAALKYVQGGLVGVAGQALDGGVVGVDVDLTNGDDTGVDTWTFALLGVPPGSALSPGTLSGPGAVPTADFQPDVRGSYRARVTVSGVTGSASDVRNFIVPNSRGWLYPAFGNNDAEINYGGQTNGWAAPIWDILDDLEDVANDVDSATSSATASKIVRRTGAGGASFAALVATALTVSTLTTGIGHFDGSGVLTSSSIINADVDASAAIDGSKIAPSFGAQTVSSGLGFNGPKLDYAGGLSIGPTDATVLSIGRPGVTTTLYGSIVFASPGTVEISSTVLDVADRVIHVNHTSTANAPVPTNIAGVSVHRGAVAGVDRDHAAWVWDETNSRWCSAFNTGGDDATLGSNTGIIGSTITGSTSVLSPVFDASSATSLQLGASTATSIVLGQAGVYVTLGGGRLIAATGLDLVLQRNGGTTIATAGATGLTLAGGLGFFGASIDGLGGALAVGTGVGTTAITIGAASVSATFAAAALHAAGSASSPGITFTGDTGTGVYRASAGVLGLSANGVQIAQFGQTSASITQTGGTGVTVSAFSVTAGPHASVPAAEITDVSINLARTVTFATTGPTTQRAVYIQAPTYAAGSPTTITTSATFAISGAPVASTNVTQTTALALFVEAGISRFSGAVQFALGTAAAPSMVAASATTTGLFWPAASSIAIATAGAERIRVDATGLTGFGLAGSASAARVHARDGDANQGRFTIMRISRFTSHASNGAAGIGADLSFTAENVAGADVEAARIGGLLTTATAGSEVGAVYISPRASAAFVDRLRVEGSGVQIGGVTGTVDALLHMVQVAATSGTSKGVLFSGAAHTGLTASTENIDVDLALNRTVTWAAGLLDAQRFVRIRQPTIAFASASTVTEAATLSIDNAPAAGANATISNPYAIWVQAGAVRFDGSKFGVFGSTPAVRQTSGADLTNNVTSGGSSDVIADYSDLTTYANDSAAIRNNIYQLARKLKQINDGLRVLGFFT